MEQYKQEFIEFMVESDVLKFGEFTLMQELMSQAASFADSVNTMQRQFMSITEMTLMCYSVRHIRGSR